MNISFVFFGVVLFSFLMMLGCANDSSDSVTYSCELPCMDVAPIISTNAVSSATGGTVDVTIKILGELTELSSLNITLRSTTSGVTAGSVVVFNPTQSLLTESITVASGTTVGDYYPYISFFVAAPSNTSSLYYLDTSKSSAQYTYYEITAGNSSAAAVSPFSIPVLQVQ